jgi:hypothetical protein
MVASELETEIWRTEFTLLSEEGMSEDHPRTRCNRCQPEFCLAVFEGIGFLEGVHRKAYLQVNHEHYAVFRSLISRIDDSQEAIFYLKSLQVKCELSGRFK